jgi:hypothetical protein
MTSSNDLTRASLVRLIRVATRTAVKEALAKERRPATVAGTVEQLDEDLDVAWVRMDGEAITADPTESANYGFPGVIPMTRLGETNTGDRVRATFDGSAGASATRTSSENVIILPFGAETGRRIIADGNEGTISFYDENDLLVGLLDTDRWVIGDLTTPGAVVQLDPIGGLTIRSADNELVTIIDQNGYTLRDGATGLVMVEFSKGHLHLMDPAGTDSIELVTSSDGSLSNPAYRSAVEVSPGASLTAPAAPLFTTTPADDIEIAHVAAWIRATQQSATMTAPAGHTEQQDENFDHAVAGTLQTSVATRDPATGLTGDFTSTQTNWQHAVGTRVVVRGGGTTSPAVRSVSYAELATANPSATPSIAKPTGTAATDILVTFVTLGVNGGGIPTGWVTPEGFVFLGANFSTSGSGATQSTLATGAWVKLAGASEPTTYETTINLPAGTKLIAASMVAISNPWLNPGGVQIRMAGKPIRRLLAQATLTANSATLCDFQNIPQGYDHLELVYSGSSSTSADAVRRVRFRLNNDSGATSYHYKITEDGVSSGVVLNTDRIFVGIINGLGATNQCWGSINVYDYTKLRFRTVAALTQAIEPANLRVGDYRAVWRNTSAAVNRVTITVDSGTTQFSTGDQAFLYGY